MQVKLDKNIYFQQIGDTVEGVYVNEPFISFKVGENELPEKELLLISTQMYIACRKNLYISNIINDIAKKYEQDPYRDGIAFVLTDNKDDLEK